MTKIVVLIVLMFKLAFLPSTGFRKFCTFKISLFATTSFGTFFIAFAIEWVLCMQLMIPAASSKSVV